eukprot:472981-Pyramimonas_sp.AAC.1
MELGVDPQDTEPGRICRKPQTDDKGRRGVDRRCDATIPCRGYRYDVYRWGLKVLARRRERRRSDVGRRCHL